MSENFRLVIRYTRPFSQEQCRINCSLTWNLNTNSQEKMGICLLNLDILLQCCRKAAAVFIHMRNYLQINILSVCKGCSLPSSPQHGTLYNIDTWWRVMTLHMSTLYNNDIWWHVHTLQGVHKKSSPPDRKAKVNFFCGHPVHVTTL